MWKTLSSVINQLVGVVDNLGGKNTFYNYLKPTKVLLTYQTLIVVVALLFIYILQRLQKKFFTQYKVADIDGKIEEIRRRYKVLKAREAVFCNLNFGGNRHVGIGKFAADTDVEKLREAIRMIEDAIEKQMTFTSELCDYIQPFIKELTGDGILPEEMELEDVLAMLQLFAKYLEDKEPVRARAPQPGEIIYPPDLEEKVEEIKDKLKKLDDLIELRQSTSRETLIYVSRKGKIEEIKKALHDLNTAIKKKSATLFAHLENPLDTSPDGNCETLANVPSSTYLADAESLAGKSINEDKVTGANIDKNCRSHPNDLCYICLGNPDDVTDVSDVENSGTQARLPLLEAEENKIDKINIVDEKCGGTHANPPCCTCLWDPDCLSDTSSD